jgi:hypothetical protein
MCQSPPPAQEYAIKTVSNFSKICGDIRKSKCTTGINDTGGKFATGVKDTGRKIVAGINDAGSKLPPVSTTPAANLPPVSTSPGANNGTKYQTADNLK